MSFEIPHADPIQPLVEDMEPDELVDEIPLRRSQKVCKPIISNDCMIYLQEHKFDVYEETDPMTFS